MTTHAAHHPLSRSMDSTRVSVVVVNWNGKHLLDRCLVSLGSQIYPNKEIIVVDNGSTDGSVPYLRNHFPWVVVMESASNVGYAGGCNLGARTAHGDYILLLNNDTRLAPDVLAYLADTLDTHPEVGAVSALAVKDLSDASQVRPGVTTLSVLGKHFAMDDSSQTAFYAPGACCMYRRELLAEPYDAAYFAYDEDVYMSWFLRLIGYEVMVDFRARFEHYAYATSRRIKGYVVFCAERNRWTNLLLFYENRTLAKLAPLILANICAKLLAAVEGLQPKLRAYAWIVRHFREILVKRQVIQDRRAASDDLLTQHMTGRFAARTSTGGRLVNRVALGYLKIVRVPTSDDSLIFSGSAPTAEVRP